MQSIVAFININLLISEVLEDSQDLQGNINIIKK